MENGDRETKDQSSETDQTRQVVNGHIDQTFGLPKTIAMPDKERKLVLHFDVRNTVLVADSVTNVMVDQALNSYLTGVVWGRERKDGEWEWYSDQPSLSAPHPEAITYYKHLERQLVKVPSDRATLRRATGDFTQEDIGAKFEPFFQKHKELLEWHDGNDPDGTLTMAGRDGKRYHYILPSFFKLIHHLHHSNRKFSIVIRTYGWDASNVLNSIQHSLAGHHPQFEEALSISVNKHPGKITRIPGQIRFESFCCEELDKSAKKTSYIEDRVIYEMLSGSHDISAFVDDFLHWQDNDYDHMAAKPMWVDTRDTHVHHIFFDDNIRVTDADSIVDLRVFDQKDKTVARSLPLEEIKQFEDMCLVQADLLNSTSSIDYFINKVKLCEENYTKYLAQQNKPN